MNPQHSTGVGRQSPSHLRHQLTVLPHRDVPWVPVVPAAAAGAGQCCSTNVCFSVFKPCDSIVAPVSVIFIMLWDKLCVSPQQSQQKTPSEKSRSKKGKEPKPRVKKLKYHQYVPPDQKQEASEAPMDSSYARLLQQQQLFLQLQILSQQQQHYNYQTILPAPLKYVYEASVR